MLEEAVKTHPEEMKQFKGSGRVRNFYHPDLIERLRSEIARRPSLVPPGWRTNFQLAKELKINPSSTQRVIDSLLVDHPAWVAEYKNKHNQTFKHVSPELADLVRKEIKERQNKTRGE